MLVCVMLSANLYSTALQPRNVLLDIFQKSLDKEAILWYNVTSVRTAIVRPSPYRVKYEGAVWGLCNYMAFDGLRKYGYVEEAKKLAYQTVELFGKDLEETGELHEFYDPETGKTVFTKGFQSWNLFAVEMVKWLKENA